MKIVTVASGKGGVGKTTLTANLGAALASRGQRVVLFDADLGLANLDVILGIESDTNIQHVLEGLVRLPEAATEHRSGLRAVVGSSGVSAMLRLSRKRLEALLIQVHELSPTTDIVIFDAASGADARVMSFLKFADEAILVTTPDPASVVDCYSVIKVLFRHRKDASIQVVVNRADNEERARQAFAAVESATSEFLHKSISYLGWVREDRAAAESTRKRKLFAVDKPGLAASRDVMEIADVLLEHPEPERKAA